MLLTKINVTLTTVFFCLSIGFYTASTIIANAGNASGKFSGSLTPRNCDSNLLVKYNGTIAKNKITLKGARRMVMSGRVKRNGIFSIQGKLRNHKLGVKLQFWSGKLVKRKLHLKLVTGVPGYPATYCTSTTTAKLR